MHSLFDHTYTKNYQAVMSIFFFWILTKLKCLKGSKTRWISCKVIDNKSAFEHAFIQRKLSSLVTWLFCLQDKCPFHLKNMYVQQSFTNEIIHILPLMIIDIYVSKILELNGDIYSNNLKNKIYQALSPNNS